MLKVNRRKKVEWMMSIKLPNQSTFSIYPHIIINGLYVQVSTNAVSSPTYEVIPRDRCHHKPRSHGPLIAPGPGEQPTGRGYQKEKELLFPKAGPSSTAP